MSTLRELAVHPVEIAVGGRFQQTTIDDLIRLLGNPKAEFHVRGKGRHRSGGARHPENDHGGSLQSRELPFRLVSVIKFDRPILTFWNKDGAFELELLQDFDRFQAPTLAANSLCLA